PGDEIADLAAAFGHMTVALKDNQQRLAARMREIVALHDAGRAVGSVIDLQAVMTKTADAIARTFDARLCALWLADAAENGTSTLRLGAARARQERGSTVLATEEGDDAARGFAADAARVAADRQPRRATRGEG